MAHLGGFGAVRPVSAFLILFFITMPVSGAQPSEVVAEGGTVTIRVVDEDSNPVAGAIVEPDGLRTEESRGGHYGWVVERHGPRNPVATNEAGIAEVSYPRYVVERSVTGAISFHVRHPDYPTVRPLDYDVLRESGPVVLRQGSSLRLSGRVGDRKITDSLFPLVSGRLKFDDWRHVERGALETRKLTPGEHHVRLVHIPENGELLFSDTVLLDAKKGESYTYDLELKPGTRVEGKLSGSVSETVRNGRVLARVHPPVQSIQGEHGHEWVTWAKVESDGRFNLGILPPGELEVIALCDGYVSTSPEGENRDHAGYPQVFSIDGETTAIRLEMEPTATCAVRVLDSAGKGIPGAQVHFWPNVRWNHGGSQIFAHYLRRTEDYWRAGGTWDSEESRRSGDFQSTTDEHGEALIENLLGKNLLFRVIHPEYELPRGKYRSGLQSLELVELSPGQTTSITVALRPKNSPNTSVPARAASEYNVYMNIGQKAPEFEGQALDGSTIRLADYRGKVVLLEFWATWCGPCIDELPNVIDTYNKYHKQGLELINVSLDTDRAALKTFLEEHPVMTWPQVFDGKGWQSEVGQLYGVGAIPFALLIDKLGVIRYRNLQGNRLGLAIESLLSE